MKRRISYLAAIVLLLVFIAAGVFAALYSSADESYVDMTTLELKKSQVGWGSLGINKGLDGNSIDLADGSGGTKVFARGFTAHAYSTLEFDLTKLDGVTVFTACIGAEHSSNNATTSATSIKFIVRADGATLYESGVMGYNDPYEEIFVAIPTGARTLTLIADDVGGNSGDHAAWASPRLIADASALETFKEITLSVEKNVYLTGAEVRLNAAFYNLGGQSFTPESVTFTSSDPTVATVTDTGLVKSLKEGLVRITVSATHKDVTLEKTVAVTFMDKADPVDFSFTSPSGNLKLDLTLDDQGALSYVVGDSSGVKVLEKSYIGVNTELCDFSNALVYENKIGPNEVDETYHNISGKRSTVRNHYSETVLTFKKDVYFFDLYIRMYDDGFAYRFALRRSDGGEEELNVVSETGSFAIPKKSYINAQYTSSLTSSYAYEDGYRSAVVDNLAKNSHPCFPATFSIYNDGNKTGKYLLLSEADCFGGGYAGSVMAYKGDGVFELCFAPKISVGSKVVVKTAFASPWRFGIYGDLADIVESDMTENLAPAADGDFSWVEPGVTAWMWLSEGFEGQRTEKTIKEYVDMASELGWKYLILDEGWQPGSSIPGKAYNGYFRYFDSLLEYAESKGVGFIAWVKYIDLDTPEEREILTEWAAKGIKGIKADFFDSEDPATLAGFKAIYEKCVENHLIVNCHGAGKPTGERRTYPNVINREAVNGEEYGGLWMSGAMYWVYARNVVGPIDITPRLLSTASGGNTTTAQMAVNVVFESGIPCMASDSEEYLNFNCKSFYRNLPAAWDDIRFLDGAIGSWASVARRSGDSWYAATMSMAAKNNVEMPLDFLDDGEYLAVIYSDVDRTRVSMSFKFVTKNDVLRYSVLSNGGYIVKFVRADKNGLYLPSGIEAPENVTISAGFRDTINYKLIGENIEVTDVLFESSDPSVVSVSDKGVVFAAKEGSAVITIRCLVDEKVTAKVNVTVKKGAAVLDGRFSIVNEAGDLQTRPTFLISELDKAVLTGNPGVFAADKTPNALKCRLPDGDFNVAVSIKDSPSIPGSAAGVAVFAGSEYSVIEREFKTANNVHVFGSTITESRVKDTYSGQQNRSAYVRVKRSGDVLTISRSYNSGGAGAVVTEMTVRDGDELYLLLYAVAGEGEGEIFTFGDYVENGEKIDFVSVADEQEPEPTPTPSPAEPTQSGEPSEPSDDPVKNDKPFKWYFLIPIAAAVIIAVVCVFLAVKKKK